MHILDTDVCLATLTCVSQRGRGGSEGSSLSSPMAGLQYLPTSRARGFCLVHILTTIFYVLDCSRRAGVKGHLTGASTPMCLFVHRLVESQALPTL